MRLRLALLVTHQRAYGLQTPTGSKSQFELVNQRAAFPFSRMTRRGDEHEDTNANGDQMFGEWPVFKAMLHLRKAGTTRDQASQDQFDNKGKIKALRLNIHSDNVSARFSTWKIAIYC